MKLPKRPRAHELESRSERFFQAALPDGWTVQRPQHDYGVDLHVEIFGENRATGRELIVQLKATEEPDGGEIERVRLPTDNYNLLRNRLQLAMVVKYVASENEAYWILLRDVPAPDQQRASFTIRIPRTNRLSAIAWDEIASVVRGVTDRKLNAEGAYRADK